MRRLLAQLLFGGRSRANALRDLVYRQVGDRALTLDLYDPRNISAPPPVILCLHGGGWCSGNKTQCPTWMLARHGYAVASVEYRLTNEATFPAQIEDCHAAIDWLRANAATYQFDADRIGVWGHSSGGHLAALLGTSGRVQAVCAISAPVDLLRMSREASRDRKMDPRVPGAIEALLGGPIEANPEQARAASPIHFVGPEAAPFLLIHGAKDRTVPARQSEMFAAALRSAGVEATLKIFPHAGHSPATLRRGAIIRSFFDRHLRG